MTRALAAALTIAVAATVSAARQPGLSTADLSALKSVQEVELSPDGATVAFTVLNYDSDGPPYPRLWTADVASGRVRPFGEAGAMGSSPRWAPDGRSLAFIGRVGDQSGLFVADARTGRARRLAVVAGTNHPLPSSGERLTWSPDGKALAFVSATPGPEGDAANADPMVITRYLYKPTASEGSTRFNDNRRLHIFVAELATGAVRQLTSGAYYEHSIGWSPKGDEIVFISNREPDPDRVFNYDIFALRVADGTIRRLTNTKSAEYHPRWSPDGRMLAFLATTRDRTSSETTMEDTHVWVMNADGSGRREPRPLDGRHGPPRWRTNDDLMFTVQWRGGVRLVGACATALCDYIDNLDTSDRVGSFSVVGELGAYALTTPARPAELVIERIAASAGAPRDRAGLVGGEKKTITRLNDDLLRERAIASVEAFTFKSHDGLEVEAFVTVPLHLAPGAKAPLVTIIHGGPHGQQGPAFNSKGQIYAAAGFGSLMVNYRGSTGYGQAFADAIFGDQNGGEAQDVLSGLSATMAKYPWIDRDALFVEGGSYGGQLVNWLVTQTGRFKAAVSMAGISNLVSFNYTAYYHDYLAVEYGGYPHERGIVEKLWERSPIRLVKDVRTPVLIAHGENDNDVPIGEAEQFYIALKDVGVDAVMVRYPREGHGVRETTHVADLIERSLAWYRKHLPDRDGGPSREP
jgi:dipeptidyl aminopeptidase/acylaminoacyl peptidase